MSIVILIEKKPRSGFKILADKGKGLCISRFHPDYLRERYLMKKIDIYWLSEMSGEKTLMPDSIEKIFSVISRYSKTHKDAIILFDGIEYLLLYNSSQKITELLKKIEKTSTKQGSTLIIHLDPDVLGADHGLYEIFAPYFTPPQEEALRQISQVEIAQGTQTMEDR